MKIIFFDIDGTLIDTKTWKVADSTKAAIRKARENGHLCIINTGRTEILLGKDWTEEIGFDGYLLGCGTMVIYQGEVLMHQTFPLELSRRIMDRLEHYGIDVILEGRENNFYKPSEQMNTERFRKYVSVYESFAKEEDVTDPAFAPGHFDKFFAYVDEVERMDGFRGEFEAELDFIDRGKGFYEVVPKGYSKATAMQFFADKVGIPLTDTVAIGDSNNDLAMLEYADCAIAMGNSSQPVLDMADYITTDVDKDGIWNALEWLGVLE